MEEKDIQNRSVYRPEGFVGEVVLDSNLPHLMAYDYGKDIYRVSPTIEEKLQLGQVDLVNAVFRHEELHRLYLSLNFKEQIGLNKKINEEILTNSDFDSYFSEFVRNFYEMDNKRHLNLHLHQRDNFQENSEGIGYKDREQFRVLIFGREYSVLRCSLFTELLSYGFMFANYQEYVKYIEEYAVKSKGLVRNSFLAMQTLSKELIVLLNELGFNNDMQMLE